MSDERTRATVRLPQEAYDQLCRELTGFSTDTARFQFEVQFYLDLLCSIARLGSISAFSLGRSMVRYRYTAVDVMDISLFDEDYSRWL